MYRVFGGRCKKYTKQAEKINSCFTFFQDFNSMTMAMTGKKLINNPENVVDEALEGLTMIHPGLRLLEGHRVVVKEKVGL